MSAPTSQQIESDLDQIVGNKPKKKRKFLFGNVGLFGYGTESKKFYYSILFIIPFLIVYVIGLFKGAMGNYINGADAFFRMFGYFLFNFIGVNVSKWLIGGVILIGIIIFISYLIIKRIRPKSYFLIIMLGETIVLSFIIALVVYFVLNRSLPDFFTFMPNPSVQEQMAFSGKIGFWSKIVSSFGAGIFEELLFRVLLLRVVYYFIAKSSQFFGDDQTALIKAVIVSSVVFSLFHLGSGVSFPWGYISIFISSLVLSTIYITRGYGIAAGSHAFYDVFLMFGIIS